MLVVRNIFDNPSVFLLRKNPPPFTQGRLFSRRPFLQKNTGCRWPPLRYHRQIPHKTLASPLGERWRAKRDGEGCSYSSPLAMNDIPPAGGAIYCSRNAIYSPAGECDIPLRGMKPHGRQIAAPTVSPPNPASTESCLPREGGGKTAGFGIEFCLRRISDAISRLYQGEQRGFCNRLGQCTTSRGDFLKHLLRTVMIFGIIKL